jgi:hypothetical protein
MKCTIAGHIHNTTEHQYAVPVQGGQHLKYDTGIGHQYAVPVRLGQPNVK